MLPEGKSQVKEHPGVWRSDDAFGCHAFSVSAFSPICVTCSRVSAAAVPALPILRILEAILESWGFLSPSSILVLAEGKLQPNLSWLLTQSLEEG